MVKQLKQKRITWKDVLIITLALVIPFGIVRVLVYYMHLDYLDVIGAIFAVLAGLWYVVKAYGPLKEIFDDYESFREDFGMFASILIVFAASFSVFYLILDSITGKGGYSYFAALIAGYITAIYYAWLRSSEINRIHFGHVENEIKEMRYNISNLENKKANQEVVSNLEGTVNKKANQEVVSILRDRVNNLEGTANKKADQEVVSILRDRVNNLEGTVNKKANQHVVSILEDNMNKKANQEVVDDLKNDVNYLREMIIKLIFVPVNLTRVEELRTKRLSNLITK